MSPLEISDRVRGTQVLGAGEVRLREKIVRRLAATFAAYGFEPAEFPLLEHLDLYMDHMREEFRDRLFILEDRTGRPLCLVPGALTGAARVAAAQKARQMRPVRLSFCQPVFRWESPRRGVLRQFTQVGIEHLLPRDPLVAAAEVAACAWEAAAAADVKGALLVLSDVGILRGAVESLDLPRAVRAILLRHLMTPAEKIVRYLPGGEEGTSTIGRLSEAVQGAVEKLSEEELVELVRALLGNDAEAASSGRSPDEVAHRLVRKLRRGGRSATHADAVAHLARLQAITGAPEEAMARLATECTSGPAIGERTERLARFLACLAASGIPGESIRIDLGLIRPQGAYDGIVFELRHGEAGPVAGGGEYDAAWAVRSDDPLPGCGAAFGLERVLAAIAGEEASFSAPPPALCVLLTAGDVPETAALHLAAALRGGGVSVRLDLPSRPLKKELALAATEGIPFVAILGEKEATRGAVNLRAMASRETAVVPVAEAAAWILARAGKDR